MLPSNPFFRAFSVGTLFFLAVAYTMVSGHEGGWTAYPGRNLIVLVVAWIITALLVGVAAIRFPRLRSWLALGIGTAMGAIVVLWLMLMVVTHLYRPTVDPKFKNLGDTMDYFAKEAAAWVKEDRGVTLDYSFESIQIVEQQLAAMGRVDPNKPAAGVQGQALGYGAYIGEVFRRHEGGSWERDHPQGGKNSYPFTRTNGHVIFPVTWCWKRITEGEADNVYLKTMLFLNPNDSLNHASPTAAAPEVAER